MEFSGAFRSLVDKVEGWVTTFITMLPNIGAAIVVMIFFWAIGRVARKILDNVIGRFSSNSQIARLLGNIAYAAIVVIGIFIGLSILNLQKTVTTLLAGVGIAGLALGFAFQDLAANFMAGILMAIRRPFELGDLILSNGFLGKVKETNLRTTMIQTLDGQIVMVPNRKVFDEPMTNYTASGRRRVDLSVGVSYGDNLQKAKQVAIEAVEKIEERDKEREVELFYEEFGGSSINFVIRFWMTSTEQRDYLQARSEAVLRIQKAFDDAGITIPFPIRTLDFGIVGGKTLAEMLPARTVRDCSTQT